MLAHFTGFVLHLNVQNYVVVLDTTIEVQEKKLKPDLKAGEPNNNTLSADSENKPHSKRSIKFGDALNSDHARHSKGHSRKSEMRTYLSAKTSADIAAPTAESTAASKTRKRIKRRLKKLSSGTLRPPQEDGQLTEQARILFSKL